MKKRMKFILLIITMIIPLFTLVLINNEENSNENAVMYENKGGKIKALVMYESEIDSYMPLVKKLKKDKNINLSITYLISQNDYSTNIDIWKESRQRLKEQLSKTDIDILLGFPYEYLSECIENNQLLKLDDLIKEEVYKNTYKPIINISKKVGNGSLYFLSPTFTTKFLLINETLLSRMNIQYNKNIMTWDEFENLAAKIKAVATEDVVPISLGPSGKEGFFMDFELVTKPLGLVIKSDNGQLYEDKKWDEVFHKFLNMYKNYGIKDGQFEHELALNGKIALRVIYPVELNNLKNANYKYSVYPIPIFKEKSDTANIIPQNIAISNSSTIKSLAVEALNYINGKEYAEYMIKNKLFPEGEFVSYFDENILDIYKNKFNSLDPINIYFGTEGYTKKEEFSLGEYSKFHEVSREVFQEILDNNISIKDGFNKIKNDFK